MYNQKSHSGSNYIGGSNTHAKCKRHVNCTKNCTAQEVRTPASHLPTIARNKSSLNQSFDSNDQQLRVRHAQPKRADYGDRSYMEESETMNQSALMDSKPNKRYQSNSPFNRSMEKKEIENAAKKKAYAEELEDQMLAKSAKKLMDKKKEMEFEKKIIDENEFFNKFDKYKVMNKIFTLASRNAYWKNNSTTAADEDQDSVLPRSYSRMSNQDDGNEFQPSGRKANLTPNKLRTPLSRQNPGKQGFNKSFEHGRQSRYPMEEDDFAQRLENSEAIENDNSFVSKDIPNTYMNNIIAKKLASMIRGQSGRNVDKERSEPAIADEVSNFIKEVAIRKNLDRKIEEKKTSMKKNDTTRDTPQHSIRSAIKAKEIPRSEVDGTAIYDSDLNEMSTYDNKDWTQREERNQRKPSSSLINLKKPLPGAMSNRQRDVQLRPIQTNTPVIKNVIGPNYFKLKSELETVKNSMLANQKKIDRQLNEFKDLFTKLANAGFNHSHYQPQPPQNQANHHENFSAASTGSSENFKAPNVAKRKVQLVSQPEAPRKSQMETKSKSTIDMSEDSQEQNYLKLIYDELARLREENLVLKQARAVHEKPVEEPIRLSKEVYNSEVYKPEVLKPEVNNPEVYKQVYKPEIYKSEVRRSQRKIGIQRNRSRGMKFHTIGVKHRRTYDLNELM